MQRWEQCLFNLFHGVVAVTGLVYLTMKYAMTPIDPFAVINHPWQPVMLSVHVVAAPVFIAVFGMIFRSHTLSKLLSPRLDNRRSGWTALLSFSAMALSGYLLQVDSSPAWLPGLVWAADYVTASEKARGSLTQAFKEWFKSVGEGDDKESLK